MKLRSLALSCVLSSALLAGCGDSNEVVSVASAPPSSQGAQRANPPANFSNFPGPQAVGEAADYTVYSLRGKLVAVPELATEWFRSELEGEQPVPFARIIYPDGSVQTADAQGDFDASRSDYAATDVPNRDYVPVTLEAAPELAFEPTEDELYVPLMADEATQRSGFIPPDAVPDEPADPGFNSESVRAQGYIWSGSMRDYLIWQGEDFNGRLDMGRTDITPVMIQGDTKKFAFEAWNRAIWFRPHANYTGTDQGVPGEILELGATWSEGKDARIRWEISVHRPYTVDKPARSRVAIWVSPNAYFLALNTHLTVIDFLR